MGILEIAGIIISLVNVFGPKAMSIIEAWNAEVGDNPTEADWAELRDKIKDHSPDSY